MSMFPECRKLLSADEALDQRTAVGARCQGNLVPVALSRPRANTLDPCWDVRWMCTSCGRVVMR